MKHFDLEQWSDFGRGVGTRAQQGAMSSHLDTGCRQCTELYAFIQMLLRFARAEQEYEVPAGVVQRAKRIQPVSSAEQLLAKRQIRGRLICDTFLRPVLAGARAHGAVDRQVLYHAGPYWLDLREERAPGSSTVALVGQIFDSQDPRKQLRSAPVLLLSGKTVLARAMTNEFGEFHMEYRPKRNLKVLVAIEGDGAAAVDLQPATAPPEPTQRKIDGK